MVVMISPQTRSFATVPPRQPEYTAAGIRRGRARALSESEEAQWRQAALQRARSRSAPHRAVLALSWLLMRLESHMEARLQKRLEGARWKGSGIGAEDPKNDGKLTESGDANSPPSRDPNPKA